MIVLLVDAVLEPLGGDLLHARVLLLLLLQMLVLQQLATPIIIIGVVVIIRVAVLIFNIVIIIDHHAFGHLCDRFAGRHFVAHLYLVA